MKYHALGARYKGPLLTDPGPTLYVPTPTAGILPDLSDNEKRLVAVGVLGVVGWFFFGDKIKKKLR